MRYYTTHTLSLRIQETPEGFLLCAGVPIARTGVQEYKPDEVPVEPGSPLSSWKRRSRSAARWSSKKWRA